MDKLADWSEHLDWQGAAPVVVGGSVPAGVRKVVVAGMGGSGLAGDLLKLAAPTLEVIVHKDYGLPHLVGLPDLFIAISHSGATAETLDSFKAASALGWPGAVIALEGSPLWLAGEGGGRVALPKTTWPARFDALLMLRALLALLGLPHEVGLPATGRDVAPAQALAEWFGPTGSPIIYSAGRNLPLAHYWEVQMEETAKRPAAINALPELDHNELEAFADNPTANWRVIILADKTDDERVQAKMVAVNDLYTKKGLAVKILELGAHSIEETLWLAGATALALAVTAKHDPFGTPSIEEFKHHVPTL